MSADFLPLHDTASARERDRLASAALGDAYILMERAGAAAWRCLLRRWPQALRIGVVCGPGNNGGDGYVLARLALEAGRRVRVVHAPDAAPRSALCRRAYDAYRAAGGAVEAGDALPEAFDLLVDAMFGIGLSRAPEGAAARLLAALAAAGVPVLALDVPSGVDAERGAVPGVAVTADCTLQFILAHRGLYTGDALEHVGERLLEPLDVDHRLLPPVAADAAFITTAALRAWLPARRRNTHKGESGRVLCLGGDHGGGGALALCAEASLRVGAGLVAAATRERHVAALIARCPEIMALSADDDGQLSARLQAADVIAIGPGLGQAAWGARLYALARASARPLVIDADALNLLAAAPGPLDDAVMTPHPGEAARLLGITTSEVQGDRFAAADALASRYRCTVVLKGAGSIVAAPGHTSRVIGAGNPGMAVGGMGDLLTGVIAGLRAQGLAAFDAACAGALLHACAGDAAARAGQRGLLPSDLLPWLRHHANPAAASISDMDLP